MPIASSSSACASASHTVEQSDRAEPEQVLETLAVILEPTPILTQLPNALRMLAELQILGGDIALMAQEALDEDNHARASGRAMLGPRQRRLLIEMVERERARWERISDISLELRKQHLRAILSAKKVPIEATEKTMSLYFPAARSSRAELFITVLDDDDERQWVKVDQCCDVVGSWVRAVKEAYSQGRPTPKIPGDSSVEQLAKEAMTEARAIISSLNKLRAVFPQADPPRVQVPSSFPSQIRSTRPSRAKRWSDSHMSPPTKKAKLSTYPIESLHKVRRARTSPSPPPLRASASETVWSASPRRSSSKLQRLDFS